MNILDLIAQAGGPTRLANTSHIEVLVTKKSNGKPIPNAAVIFNPSKDGKDEGSLEVKTDPDGNTTHSEYDLNSNVTASIDAEGNETTYAYDNMGDQIAVTDPLQHTSRTVYDGFANEVASIDPAGNETVTAYNLDKSEQPNSP